MKMTIPIYLVNNKLEDLGIESEDEFADFHFDTSCFFGYWIVKDDEGKPIELMTYIGGQKFVTPYSEKTINLFETILNDKS